MLEGKQDIANFLLDHNCRVAKPGSVNLFIHAALRYCNWTDIIGKLLYRGVPVSTIDADNNTAVHVAFKKQVDGDLLDALLAMYVAETNVNAKDTEELSILHIACSRDNLEIVKALTEDNKGGPTITTDDLNAQVQWSRRKIYRRYTPLHFAVRGGCVNIVKHLVGHFHVDFYKVDANASTPLHLALERGDTEIIDFLLSQEKIYVNSINNFGFTHFMAACAGSDTSIAAEYIRFSQYRPGRSSVRSLINGRVAQKFGHSPYKGYSALHFAAEFGRLPTVELLLQRRACCSLLSAANETPLSVALKRGHEDIARLLWKLT